MTQDTFLIALPPQQLRALQGWDAVPAYLSYRAGPGSRLLRSGSPAPRPGGLMVVDDQGYDGLGNLLPFCRDVLREVQMRGFSGVVLDFDRRLPPLEQIAVRLEEGLSRRKAVLYVPETYGTLALRAKVLISSALSGGSLAQRLEEAGEQFGRDRVVLAVEPVREDFPLPCPTGCGDPLSREGLAELMDRRRPSVFFSRELCARYFTYMDREAGAHFVLFDDGETIAHKLEVARKAGINTVLLPLAEVQPHLGRLGVRKLSNQPVRG